MKVLLFILEGACPDTLLGDERLQHVRMLMDTGLFGSLEPVIPSTLLPSLICLETGRDPGMLGLYGPVQRQDRSYNRSKTVDRAAVPGIPNLADFVEGRSISIGTLTKNRFSSNHLDMTTKSCRTQFDALRNELEAGSWSIAQIVDHGLVQLTSQDASDYSIVLDAEIGQTLELLDDETVVLVVSTAGVRQTTHEFWINNWLHDEGYLAIRSMPDQPSPLWQLNIDWSQTQAWSDGNFPAHIYLNVIGRESEGTIDPAKANSFRDDLIDRINNLSYHNGQTIGIQAYQPEVLYRDVQGIPPDIIMTFGNDAWRAVPEIRGAQSTSYISSSATPNISPGGSGMFILAAGSLSNSREIERAGLLDLMPTLLELLGIEVPTELPGRSLLSDQTIDSKSSNPSLSQEEIIRNRLSGLGYI